MRKQENSNMVRSFSLSALYPSLILLLLGTDDLVAAQAIGHTRSSTLLGKLSDVASARRKMLSSTAVSDTSTCTDTRRR